MQNTAKRLNCVRVYTCALTRKSFVYDLQFATAPDFTSPFVVFCLLPSQANYSFFSSVFQIFNVRVLNMKVMID